MAHQSGQRVIEVTLPRVAVTDPSTCLPETHRQFHGNDPFSMDPSTCISESHHLRPEFTLDNSVLPNKKFNRSHQDDIDRAAELVHDREKNLDRIHNGSEKKGKFDPYNDSSSDDDPEASRGRRAGEPAPPRNWVTRFRHATREFWAEFFGTAVLLFFGTGVNVQALMRSSAVVGGISSNNWLTVSFGWGVALMAGLYVSSGVSGGHLNPAVTLTLALFRGFPLKKVPYYILAQFLGAFVGAALIYLNYSHALSLIEGGAGIKTMTTGALFFTSPLDFVPNLTCFFEEFMGTLVLMMFILAVNDGGNLSPPVGTAPFVMLWVLFGICSTIGMQTGFALNPARDLGPRLLCWVLGYGKEIWTYRKLYWLWCPTLAPLCGAMIGSLLYDSLIGSDFIDSPVNKSIFKSKRRNPTADSVGIQQA